MPKNGGILSGGFQPLKAPDAPTTPTATGDVASATLFVDAPSDTGGAPITEYRFQIVNTADDSDQSETSESTSKQVALPTGTYRARAVSFNKYGPSQPTAYSSDFIVFDGYEAYATGRNIFGEMGLGDRTGKSSPVQIASTSGTIMQIESGDIFTGFVTTENKLFMMGFNSFGQLGQQNTTARSSPVQVGSLTNWAKTHPAPNRCASIKTDGTLWTWGLNSQGELGHNDVINRSSTAQVGSDTDWADACGGESYYIFLKTDGTLWAVGGNSQAQLGDNTVISKSSPIQIGSDTDWAEIMGCVGYTSFVKKTDGTVYGWGGNNNGELGLNNRTAMSSPVQLSHMTNIQDMGPAVRRAGGYPGEALHYVTESGQLFFLGANFSGVGGVGDAVNRSSPTQVGALTNWAKAGTSGDFAHAIKTDGTLWAWGSNSSGQYGDGTSSASKSSPVQIGVDTGWLDIPRRLPRETAILLKGNT